MYFPAVYVNLEWKVLNLSNTYERTYTADLDVRVAYLYITYIHIHIHKYMLLYFF